MTNIIFFFLGIICGAAIVTICYLDVKYNKSRSEPIVIDGTKEIVYISGKMSKMDEADSKLKFKRAEQDLAKAGYNPINPWEIEKNDPNMTWGDCLLRDLKIINKYADSVYMLDNWRTSNGAKTEHYFAEGYGIRIFYQDEKEMKQND